MARGRMLDRAFTKSRKINSLHRDHRLMYASILPFLDREGRIVAEPIVLKANVFRWTDFTLDEIAAGVVALEESELIRLYADEDNEAILQYVDFGEYNSPNVKESKSDFPGPDDSGSTPVRDEGILSAKHKHEQGTGNARAPQVENVNETLTLTKNENERHSSTSNELEPSNQPTMSPKGDASKIDYQEFIDVYNENCGDLPGVTKLTKKRRRSIGNLVKEHGQAEALGLLYDATRLVAMDEYWNEKNYNLDNLLVDGRVVEKAEKQRAGKPNLNRADRKLVNRYQETMDAIGDFA